MNRQLLLIAALAAASLSLSAAAPQLTATPQGSGRTITVTPMTDNIVRVTNTPAGAEAPAAKLVETPAGAFTGTVTTDGSRSTIASPTGMRATLDAATGELLIDTGHGRHLFDNGQRGTDASGRQTMKLMTVDLDPVFYGGGERGYHLNLLGDTLVMYNRQNYGYQDGDPRTKQMNITMPVLVSPNGYALVFDDYAAAELVADLPLQYTSESPEPVTYYFVTSPEGFRGIPKELSQLTGRQDLPPFWSLGYITSKYGYKTRHEADSVVTTLKKAGYPLDGIVLDLYWYGIEQDMGRLEWDPEQWPDHKKMLADLKKKGVNLVAISQPYVLRNGRAIDNYNYMADRGMFGKDENGDVKEVTIWVGEGGMFDVSNPETRQWLRERYRQLTDDGITGWWGDLGEPEVHPDSMYHANGLTTRLYHNLYGNEWSQIIYDLFKEEYPDRRLMTLMRGGTIGLQKYSVYPWSTDVSRSWGGLQPQVKIMLNSALSGLGYMSHDIGGFATVDSDTPWDPELYVRWLQMGQFTPIFRTHAQSDSEPYLYTDYQDIILPLVRERYAWLPYNYTLAWEYTTTGMPLVRPIGMYTDNPADYDGITDEYLWGRDVLVAPVMNPGVTERRVVFPTGSDWVNLHDPSDIYAGGSEAVVAAPIQYIPVFVRGGSLLARADYKMENTGDYRTDNYTVNYYPTPGCGDTNAVIYEDDRTSPSTLERNDFALIRLDARNSGNLITLSAEAEGSWQGMPSKRTITYVVHDIDRPANVVATKGKLAKTVYDSDTRTLTLRLSGQLPFSVTITR